MKFKLGALCSFFLAIIVITNIIETYQIQKIVEKLNDITQIQLPAVKKMGLVDMHHDGMVGIVYKSIYASEINNEELKKIAMQDYLDGSQEMRKLLGEINELNLKADTKKAIEDAMPAINLYLSTAKDIIDNINQNKRAEAISKTDSFEKSFMALEESLGKLSDLIEADAIESQKAASALGEKSSTSSLLITVISLLIGVIASFVIIKFLVRSISNAVEELSTSVHDVQNTSHIVNMISGRLSTSVDTQASSITESVTAMDEISAMIRNNDQSATNASNLSELTKASAESGKETVAKMLEEMREISQSYDDIQKTTDQNKVDINKIVDVINQIAKKTEVINDIVFQTKLLSFNASVEAARAGESGKGFAVVAEEVGNLAQMSGKASNDIEQMLIDSQVQVKSLANLTTTNIEKIVSAGRVKIKNGSDVAQDCMNELEKIQSCAYNLNNSIGEISNAIKEQSIGVDEVNSALKQLENATHETTDMSEKSKNASVALKEQSHALRSTIQSLRKILGAKKSYDATPLE